MRIRKKLVYIGIIAIIVIGADLLIGAVSKNAILNVKDVGVNQTNTVQALFKRKADVLILGPSTANHHFDCRLLGDSIGLTCYNAGRDGQNVIYDAIILEAFLTRCTPKIVVVDVTSSTLSDVWMDRLHELNCYYGVLDPVDSIMDCITSPMDKMKRISGLYRYNKTWEWLLNAKLSKEKQDLDGFRPMPINLDTHFSAQTIASTFSFNESCLHYLIHIIEKCKTNGISIILTHSPSLIIDHGSFCSEIKRISKQRNVCFMNWNGDTAYTKHPELFYDMTHLNEKGAREFTKDFINRLKKYSYGKHGSTQKE